MGRCSNVEEGLKANEVQVGGEHALPGEALKASDRQVGGSHYKEKPVQPWDVVDTWPLEARIGFYRGNALKYVMRMEDKDSPRVNAEKAIHYLEKLIEILKSIEPVKEKCDGEHGGPQCGPQCWNQ
jgi:hypothetical protein